MTRYVVRFERIHAGTAHRYDLPVRWRWLAWLTAAATMGPYDAAWIFDLRDGPVPALPPDEPAMCAIARDAHADR